MASLDQLTGNLGRHRAKHLLNRATYAVTPALINSYADKTAAQAVTDLFTFQTPVPVEPYDKDGELCIPTPLNPTATTNKFSPHSLLSWWMGNAKDHPTLQYKLAFFLHGIWVCDASVQSSWMGIMFDYLALLSYYSDKSIRDLATRMTMNNRMMYYLDNRLNTVNGPNENYGREVLELFTITKGPQIGTGNYTSYTEADVAQASRVLTGFTNTSLRGSQSDEDNRLHPNNINPITGICEGMLILENHDTGDKTFSSSFGDYVVTGRDTIEGMWEELDEFFDMVFAQDRTATVLAERIYRYFVGRNITTEIADDIIAPIATTLKNNNYDLKLAVTQLLTSQHFFDADDAIENDEIIGGMIKSPLDLMLVTLSIFDFPVYESEITPKGYVNFYFAYEDSVAAKLTGTGGEIFAPSNVNGYPANTESPSYDRLWVSTSKLPVRYDMFNQMFIDTKYTNQDPRRFEIPTFVTDNTTEWFSDPSDAYALVDEFLDLCMPFEITGDRLDYFRQALLGNLSLINWQNAWNNYIADPNDPVYELDVRTGLDRLANAIIKSAEYQIK